jgi:hypothetical protein
MVEKNPCDRVATDAELESEMVRLSAAVDAFASEMKAKLLEKAREGRKGWDNPALRNDIYTAMLANGAGVPLAAGTEANVANFAMMLWYTRTHD